MSGSIKDLSLRYDLINESNTFTSGDIVEGRVVLEVTKEIKVDSFFVKLTGDAHVSWTEGSGDDEISCGYSSTWRTVSSLARPTWRIPAISTTSAKPCALTWWTTSSTCRTLWPYSAGPGWVQIHMPSSLVSIRFHLQQFMIQSTK